MRAGSEGSKLLTGSGGYLDCISCVFMVEKENIEFKKELNHHHCSDKTEKRQVISVFHKFTLVLSMQTISAPAFAPVIGCKN